MTREGKWPLAATIVVVLATVLLAACGSSDSDTSNSTAANSTGSTTTAQNSDGEQSQGGQKQGGSQGKSKDQDQHSPSHQGQQGGGGNSNGVAPLKVSGGGSAQFRTKGGDNSIQEFGEEGESELQEVAETVHSFYVARGEENWDAACSYLAKPNVEQLVELVSQSPKFKGVGCGGALNAFTQPVPPAIEREITTVDAGSFRHENGQGFLIYFGPKRAVYAMPMREEDGVWKVVALSGNAIG